jgi:exodeoxyribonuclease V gamma subunit
VSGSLELPFEVPIEPGLMIVHGNRQEDLRDLLTAWLARAPLHPLENELMLVQSNGIAQWLKLALARSPETGGLGISAAIDVQLPGRFLWAAYRAVLGRETVPPTSPFDKSRLTWRLLRLIPQHLHDADFVPLKDFLGTTPDWNKKFQLAERIADLFDQYQVYRADWLTDWEARHFVLRDELRDRITPLPGDQRWQARLWRLLLDDVGEPACHSHRAAIHQAFLQRIQTIDTRPAALPRRIVVFGISSLPQQTLEALTALAQFSQVLLIVANPCRHYWADIIEDRELLKASQRRQLGKPGLPAEPRYEDLHLHANPLLAAWGKQGRDYIRLLDAFDQPERYRRRFTALNRSIDLFTDIGEDTLLQQVQQAILDLEPLPTEPARRKAWRDGDDSLRFHIAHNPQREVEILHDQLLALFEQAAREGHSLAPRDVIVMVPDIRTYAPHVRAVFGRLASGDPRHLPYTVADQPARGTAPLIVALEHLLALPESRFAVSEILDLLDVPALRLRFGVKETDLPTLRRWIDGAGIRWGFDGAQIQSLELPALEQNSWIAGLRRMLLGYAVGEGDMRHDDSWLDIAPYGEIGGLDAAMLGPLSLLLEKLEHYWRLLRTHASPKEWSARLRALLADHFKASESEDDELLNRLHDVLDSWQQACDEAGFAEEIPLATVRDHWLGAIDESRLSQRFMGGAVSFGTLMPMRAIPFRVVCLLGMNDGDYPRRQTPVDFDLMALPGHARPGDRSRREDDRYLFLEALLSARDALHISWVGHSARDNSELPPSVLVGQLRDYLAAGWRAENQSDDLLDTLTTAYPLQPFSRRYFGLDDDARVFTYASEWQLAHRTQAAPTAIAALLPWQPETALNLGQLQSFLSKPVRYFFNHRLKVHFAEADIASADEEPFALDGLQRHQARQEVLLNTIDSDDTSDAIAYASRRLRNQGALPPGGFGELAQAEIANETRDLAAIWHAIGQLSIPVADKYELRHGHHGLHIEDWLTDLRQEAHEAAQHTIGTHPSGRYVRLELINGKLLASGSAMQNGKLRYDKLTATWAIHLLANAQGIRMQTQLIGVDAQPILRELSRADACTALNELLHALHDGMAAPLPLARKTAFAYLQAERDEEDPIVAARLAYEGDAGGYRQGELQEDAYLSRAWPRFDALLQAGFIDRLAPYRRLMDATIMDGGAI